jgi:hypothetical protein
MQTFIAKLNIEHFGLLIGEEKDPVQRAVLEKLLGVETEKLLALALNLPTTPAADTHSDGETPSTGDGAP